MSRTEEIAREQELVRVLYARLDELRDQARARLEDIRRRGASGTPQARSERDAFAALYEDRLAQLEGVEPGLCFGRLDLIAGDRLHVGRIGLADEGHDTLLVDWRAPAAEPFYRATPTEPYGVTRRRQLRTKGRVVIDVEDDVFDVEGLTDADRDTLGGGGALLAALGEARTGRMRDIVATIQAEQDRVIRSEPAGVLVVQGGPGTGKTAVALHRAAYLLYTHRDRLARTGVLVIGPGPTFMRYIEQVLPSLGETGVVLSTVEGLVPDVQATGTEPVEVAALKADLRMAELLERAVADRQRVPDVDVVVGFEEHELVLTPHDIATARKRARRSPHRHNRARYAFAKQLLRLLVGRLAEIDPELARERWVVRQLMSSEDFRTVVDRAWPRLSAPDFVRELLTAPVLTRIADDLLTAPERASLVRAAEAPWTAADVPLIDEAWALLGDPDEVLRAAGERRRLAADREYAREVVAASGLRGQVNADQLAQRYAGSATLGVLADRAANDPDWEFGHVIVDEAQELSPMAWRMLARRCPLRSMTVVGDIAQASAPWSARSWAEVLDPVAPDRWRVEELTVNYRTPSEVMAVAADVLAEVDPQAESPSSVRDSGERPVAFEVVDGDPAAAAASVAAALGNQVAGGTVAVVAAEDRYGAVVAACRRRFGDAVGTGAAGLDARIAVLSVAETKGLEFDGVVLVEPAGWIAAGDRGLRDLYVALTRPTQRLAVVHTGALPGVLHRLVPAGSAYSDVPVEVRSG